MLRRKVYSLFLLAVLSVWAVKGYAQIAPGSNLFQQADSANRADSLSRNKGWQEVNAKIYFTTLGTEIHRIPDTTLQHFQNFQPRYPWWGVDLGNYGSAVKSLLFQPWNTTPGLSSGYHVYDLYQLSLDSLRFYNTTNPYSVFSFLLGSKDQQLVNFLHTQNINPYWNFAANLRANSSTGYFSGQTAKNFSGSLNTNYSSKNQRYKLKAAMVYNHFYQDENGGITSDTFLNESNFSDRSRIPTQIPTLGPGQDKSAINNILSDFDFFIQNNYSWGRTDTAYNKDSTKETVIFTPRFRLQYDFQLHTEKHQYNDYLPDSTRYGGLVPFTFAVNDTLKGRQKWTYLSNKFSLNGFIGKDSQLTQIQAGIGNRIDQFSTLIPYGNSKESSINTFLFGSIQKEAFTQKQWHYDAQAQLYVTGQALGDFDLNIHLGKQINEWSGFVLGFSQSLVNAPQSYDLFASNFFDFSNDFKKESITKLQAGIQMPKLKFNVYADYLLLTNYLYYNYGLMPQQQTTPISLLQIFGNKQIRFGEFTLDNLLAWQQSTKSSPIHIPTLMAHEELAYNASWFKQALGVRAGIGIRYVTNYYCDGYSYYLNQFFVQNSFKTSNLPELSIFFNFSVHHFRAFVSFDQLQQLIAQNNINAVNYPNDNMMFRFGFKWVLIN